MKKLLAILLGITMLFGLSLIHIYGCLPSIASRHLKTPCGGRWKWTNRCKACFAIT